VTALLTEEPAAAELLRQALVLSEPLPVDVPLAAHARRSAAALRDATGAACAGAVVVRVGPAESADRTPSEAALTLLTPLTESERQHTLVTHPQEFRRRVTLWAAEFFLLALQEAVARARGSTATSA
jgi:hypothetical protein